MIGRMNAVVERRLLVNYRVDPALAATWLPDGLRLHTVNGSAVAGLCLIRLTRMAPPGVPSALGWGAENAAQRIAVEWGTGARTHRGVYISQRYSASRIAVGLGGRLFPGVHRLASITSTESTDRVRVVMRENEVPVMDADVSITDELSGSLFGDIETASEFFRQGSIGWSPGRHEGALDGLALATDHWHVEPTTPNTIHSTFFDGLPAGAAELDSALIMRNVPVTWHAV